MDRVGKTAPRHLRAIAQRPVQCKKSGHDRALWDPGICKPKVPEELARSDFEGEKERVHFVNFQSLTLFHSTPSLAPGTPPLTPGTPSLAPGTPPLAPGTPSLASGTPSLRRMGAASEPGTLPLRTGKPPPVAAWAGGRGKRKAGQAAGGTSGKGARPPHQASARSSGHPAAHPSQSPVPFPPPLDPTPTGCHTPTQPLPAHSTP